MATPEHPAGIASELRKLSMAALVFVAVIASWFVIQKVVERFARLPEAAGGPCALWFVGSSTMHKWTALSGDMAPWTAYNRGVDGATIQEVAQMFANEPVGPKPRAIVLYLGDNDIANGLGAEATVNQLRQIIATKRKLYGPTRTFVVSIKPSPGRLDFLDQQRRYNREAGAIAASSRDLVFVDVANRFMVNGRPGDFYVPDGVHLNAAGYQIMARGIHSAIDTQISASQPRVCKPQNV